jgi:hypothetical protein
MVALSGQGKRRKKEHEECKSNNCQYLNEHHLSPGNLSLASNRLTIVVCSLV